MPKLVSPGVAWREVDFTTFAQRAATSILGVVGQAKKGPVNTPIELFSASDMLAKVGAPDPNFNDFSLYCLSEFFKTGRQAWFVRVTDGNEVTADSGNFVDATPTDLFKVEATSPGEWANEVRVRIENSVASPDYDFDLVVEIVDPVNTTEWIEVERYEAVSLDPGAERYIEEMVNEGAAGQPRSEYIVLTMDPGFTWNPSSPNVPVDTTSPHNVLTGGYDGGTISDSDYIGTAATSTGVYALQDPETLDVNIIAVPGPSSTPTVAEAMRTVCEDIRKDCCCLIDPPSSATDPDLVKTWRDSLGINSSYVAALWPQCKIHDEYNSRNIWVPASTLWPRTITHSDDLTEAWFSPAGLNRGILRGVLDLSYYTNQAERDALFVRQYAINCIKKEPGIGFSVWGDLTLYTKPSALQLLPVRRMLLFIEKTIAGAVRFLLFEPNDPTTWATFVSLVLPVLQVVKDARGLEDYKIIADSTTTTPAHQQRREMNANLKIIPVNTVHKINMDFSLYPSGASFSE